MASKFPSFSQLLALLLSGAAYAGLAYATPRTELGQLLVLFAAAGVAYVWLLRSQLPLRWGLGAALVFRLLWLPAQPALSDDIYRFHWDGLLVSHGVSPFRYRPDEIIADGGRAAFPAPAERATVVPQLQRLYRQLNSPHYYSVYPPVCQAIFGGAARLFPVSDRGFATSLRTVVLVAEAATAWLLLALLAAAGRPPIWALRYLLHPLVVVELAGNLHFEGIALAFTLLALWLLGRQLWAASAGALALGVATKLLPLLVLPLLVRRLGWRRLLAYTGLLGGALLLLFSPFLSLALVVNVSRSLNLYFRSFEFNASLYYLLRAVGYWLTTYNQIAVIGPALALLSAATGLGLAWRERALSLAHLPPHAGPDAHGVLRPGHHGTPVVPHLAGGPGQPHQLPLPLAWGGLRCCLTRRTAAAPTPENLWLVGLEYAVTLTVLSLEIFRRMSRQRPNAALLKCNNSIRAFSRAKRQQLRRPATGHLAGPTLSSSGLNIVAAPRVISASKRNGGCLSDAGCGHPKWFGEAAR